jgi:hypothetical protein
MNIKINTSSFLQTPGNYVCGQVWIEINGKSFPTEGWQDFPVAFLSALLSERENIGKSGCRIYFLDGPASFEFADDKVCFYRYDDLLFVEAISANELKCFVDELVCLAREALGFCIREKYEMTADLRRLLGHLEKLGS